MQMKCLSAFDMPGYARFSGPENSGCRAGTKMLKLSLDGDKFAMSGKCSQNVTRKKVLNKPSRADLLSDCI